MHALVYTRSSAPRTFRRGAYSLVDAARSHTVCIRKYVYMRCMNAFVLCIRCILGDIRLWVGDPSTSSFLVSSPRVYQRMHVLVYTWSSALRTVRRSAHQQFLRCEVIYISRGHPKYIYVYIRWYIREAALCDKALTSRFYDARPYTYMRRSMHVWSYAHVIVCTCDRMHALVYAYWVCLGRCRANSVLSCSFRRRGISCPDCSTFIG